jgi:hypothetical protein
LQIIIIPVSFEIEENYGNAIFGLGEIYRGQGDLEVEVDCNSLKKCCGP